ncbi:hypothetical protein P175DRAFT_0470906 [Aspergillus ochraceoroseus IBT 24754]|uniref:Zn(2)-C6 fungal-type domain-containing protein n=2 Tax=Aspergillus ochraceoroseus TaxID=138278 RepID=A0A2T5M7X0_9EURO|nr:uncharacterized protein P175DRAFT_0470906 [Aspergillus ochraceoroseus IBT 24754]KKK14092.1 hypothetical protein AOCH_000878 [Aspergillus ochraceoroseus]PTU24625.1 hypothetical protein P175DRAFT_0470906 [Aspergillus ochraceoroseus IBT 24754]
MKRKNGPEHLEEAEKRMPRQDPVSCQSCRRKKLKCDRQRPCGSCSTRRLSCTYGVDGIPHVPNVRAPTNRTGGGSETSARAHVHASAATRRKPAQSPAATDAQSRKSKESLLTADWLEHIHMGDRVPAALSPQLRAELDEPRNGEHLANTGLNARSPRALFSMFQDSLGPDENPATINLTAFLPQKADTMDLLKYYFNYINHLYRIIVPQLAEEQINEVYQCVESGLPLNINYLALLFALIGSSLYLQLSIESSAHAEICSQKFSFLTGAALTQANYVSYPTIEGLQASLVVFHNLSNVHCCNSVSAIFMLGSLVSQAKNMMLHRIDTHVSREQRDVHGYNFMELEIKRRLWWDIASFDWLLGFLSGPQEWTYLINPEFMHVEKPSNLDDTAIGMTPVPPDTAPTDMTFFLERLKLAEACRSVVDGVSSAQLQGTELDYPKLLELDHELQQAQSEIPDVFRLDSTSRRRHSSLCAKRPTFAWQRSLLQQAYYSRFCRLHRPFFIRGARDPKYSYSHIICLQSARKVLEIKRIMDEEEPRFAPSSSVIWSIMHHVFMAAVILLLDVCYNWDDLLADKRREEVLEACRMLSRAQQSSSLVKEGINSMMSILQRHYQHGKSTTSAFDPAMEVSRPEERPAVASSLPDANRVPENALPDSQPVQSNAADDEGRELEDVWAEIIDSGGNLDFEAEDWTGLFTELTNAVAGGT